MFPLPVECAEGGDNLTLEAVCGGEDGLLQAVDHEGGVVLEGPHLLAVDGDAPLDQLEGGGQDWSLTQLYSVDFSQSRISFKKCVFYKRTIKVCVSYC